MDDRTDSYQATRGQEGDSMDMIVEKPQIYHRCVMYRQTDGLTDRPKE